jgi:hypothetical protein
MRPVRPGAFVLAVALLAADARAADEPEPDRPRLLEAVQRITDGRARASAERDRQKNSSVRW